MPYDQMTNRLVAFGSDKPDIVFVGMEEACHDAHDHRIRVQIHAERGDVAGAKPMDVVAYHKTIDERRAAAVAAQGIEPAPNYVATLFGAQPRPRVQPTWNGLIRFEGAFTKGNADVLNIEAVRQIQRTAWGREGSAHVLAEFLPLAHPSVREWYGAAKPGSWWNSRVEAVQHFTDRATAGAHPVQNFLEACHPRVALAYGFQYLNTWRPMLGGSTEWNAHQFSGQTVHWCHNAGRLNIITKHPTARGMTPNVWTHLGIWARNQVGPR